MKEEVAKIRRDCTVALPPDVMEALGVTCGKCKVGFTVFRDQDVPVDQDSIQKMTNIFKSLSNDGAFIVLTALKGEESG